MVSELRRRRRKKVDWRSIEKRDIRKGFQERSQGVEYINMKNLMKLERKLEGASNYRAWKKRIDLILVRKNVGFCLRKSEGTNR